MQAYAIQTDAGIRLFDTEDAAAQYQGLDGHGYEMPVAVTKSRHYRGDIGPKGVLFTPSDVSFSQILAAINGRS